MHISVTAELQCRVPESAGAEGDTGISGYCSCMLMVAPDW